MTSINLANYVERDNEGNIDVAATVLKFEKELNRYKVGRETELETINNAINNVFDKYNGVKINIQALISFACQEMNAQPEVFNIISSRIQNFVKENSGKREDGAIFGTTQGKSAGIFRWKDNIG